MLAGSIFDPLYHVVGLLLAVLYYPLHNLGLAIIVLTVIVMFIQLPLIAKQTRSMILMQRVQPEIKKIQAEIQGRPRQAERRAPEVLPGEQDQSAGGLPAHSC